MVGDFKQDTSNAEPINGQTFGEAFLQFLNFVDAAGQAITRIAEQAQPLLDGWAKIDWKEVARRLDALSQNSKEAMILCLDRGWFFGWHDSLQSVLELAESLTAADTNQIDGIMIAYYRKNLHAFTNELARQYPERTPAIKAAVTAHTDMADMGYLLSVPVFIAQGDGLLAHLSGEDMGMRDGPAVFRNWYRHNSKATELLDPLFKLNGADFMLNSKERRKRAASGVTFNSLNRHQVMHGERSDYGTEMNSLKAFSFLVFVGLHLPTILHSHLPKKEF